MNKTELVKAWPIKAWHDLENARISSSADPEILDTAVYHCQQAAEKSVKALLTFHDIRFEKTHSIETLLDSAVTVVAELSSLIADGESLSPYAQAFRYPGDDMAHSLEEFTEAFATAMKIYRKIISLLPQETHP